MKVNNEEKTFYHVLQCENPKAVFDTLKKVILSDENLDEKQKVQKMIDLIQAYKGITIPIYFTISYFYFNFSTCTVI